MQSIIEIYNLLSIHIRKKRKKKMLLRDYLHKKKIKQNAFSKMCGLSPLTIFNVVHGKVDLKLSVAKKIVRATNGQVSYEDLGKIEE